MMKRRSVLQRCALVTTLSFAGCLGEAEPGDDQRSPTPSSTVTTTRTTDTTDTTDMPTDPLPSGGTATDDVGGTRLRGTGGPGVTLVGTDDRASPVEHAVEVVREAATTETPPRLRVSLTNTGDEAVRVGEGRAVVFAYRSDTDEQSILLPPDDGYPAEAGCWRLTEPIAVSEEYRTITLTPGETVRQSLDLYATAGGDGCLPVGEFRFETTFRYGPATNGGADGTATTATWGFTMLVE